MRFDTYQNEAAKTAIYPASGTGNMTAIAYLGLGLGEAGEVQGKIKKILRDYGGRVTDESRIAIQGELGDLLWYIAMLARELGIDLDAIATGNLTKLSDRMERGMLQGSGDNR